MSVDRNLLSEFAKITNDTQANAQTQLYGTVVTQGDKKYVKMDGSDIITPIISTTDIKDGERVMVSINNHIATVTGNITDPSVGNDRVSYTEGKVDEFDYLFAGNITAENIAANSITADKILAGSITTDKLMAESIIADKIAADAIESKHIKADAIESKHIKADAIEAEHIKAGIIESDHISSGTITADKIATGTITAGSGIIADGAIGNAQISSLDVAKLESGTIDTSKIYIAGADGHLQLKGNRLQVFDGLGNSAVERVSVGDVNGDGSKFGLRVRGADGETILLDENGVTSEGITDGSITNNKISDDANIDGAKLNINSVVSKINEDSTETIQGTKIEVDGTTLNTKLSTITNKQTEDGKRITQAQSQITANTNAIKLKVDEQTYTMDKKDMTSKLEKNTSEISAMKGQIALKVEQTDIENAKSEMEGVIDTKVNSAKSEIKITTDAIKQNVSNLSQTVSTKADGSTVTTLSNKVGSLETGINGISGKVTSLEKTTTTLGTQVNTANTNASSALNKAINATTTANNAQNIANTNKSNITNLQGEVSTVKNNVASLEVKTSGISQKVSSVESTTATLSGKVDTANNNATNALNTANSTNTKLNNLQIGGRNLLRNSQNYSNWLGENGTTVSAIGNSNGPTKILQVTTNGSASGHVKINVSNYIKGKEYILSFYAKNISGDKTIKFEPHGAPVYSVTSTSEWMQYKVKIIPSLNWSSTSPYFYFNNKNNTSVFQIKNVKLEEGNKPTDWSPAPEDVDGAINAVDGKVTTLQETVNTTNSKVATLETNLNGITQRVSSTESTTATLTTKVNNAQSTADSAKSTATTASTNATNALNTANSTNTKLNNLQIGGRNLIRKANVIQNNSTATFNESTKTWTIKASAGAGGAWGCGLVLSSKNILVPYGKSYVLSFEIKVPRNCRWNVDINNYALTGASWGGNDNDNVSKRTSSSTNLTANQWIKCWAKWENTNTNNTTKVDLYDNSNFGVVMQNETSDMTYEIRNIQGELGNMPTEYTPAPEDVDGAINSVDSKVNTLRTEYNSTKSKVATIETNLSGITSRVSSTETNIEKISNASSQNLLYNSDFRIINGSLPDGWSVSDSSKISLDPNTTLLDGIPTFWFDVRGLTENTWHTVYSPFISAKAGEKFVASAYVLGYNNWSVLDAGGGLEIEYYNDGGRISTSGVSINKSNLNWQRLVVKGIAPTGTTRVRIRVHPVKNGQFNMSKPMLQYGETVTGWDRGFDINNLTTRLKTAESKITDTAITNVVKQNFYTKSETNSQITSKGYQTSSQVQQTVDALQMKFEQSGGYNLLKNSAFKNGANGWSILRWDTQAGGNNGIGVRNIGDDWTLTNRNSLDASVTNLPNTSVGKPLRAGFDSHKFKVRPNTTYTLNCLMAQHRTRSISIEMLCYDSADNRIGTSNYGVTLSNVKSGGRDRNNWTKVKHTWTTPSNAVTCHLRAFMNEWTGESNSAFMWICEPLITEGNSNLPWTPNADEVYTGITTIDKEGITVKQSNISTYTTMDASSFRVGNNTGGTVAEFSQNSQIPNLTAGIINANEIYANNIVRKSTHVKNYYVAGGYGNDVSGAGGNWNNPCKTVQYVLDNYVEDVLDYDVNIYVGQSVPGWTCKSKSGKGVISFLIQDDCIIGDPLYLDNCTNRIAVHGTDAQKGTFMTGIVVTGCHNFDIGWVSFRGKNWAHNSGSCNVLVRSGSKGIIRCNDFNGCSFAIIVDNNSEIWVYKNRGSDITHYIGIGAYTTIYGMRSGSDVCPDFTGYYYADAGHVNLYHIHDGANYTKTPSIGWAPSYTPSQKTQTWNFNNIWSDETLKGWSDRQELIQGYSSTWNTGRWTGYIQMADDFAAIRNAISGGTNLSGRIYIQRTSSSGNSTGSKLCLYGSDGTLITNSTSINRGQGVWVSLSSSIIQKIQSGAIKYFYLKADADNKSTYFKCERNCKIEITYTK